MSRYTGPRLRKARALGRPLPGLTPKSVERRPYPPGQHGQARRRKPSEYKVRLQEKQVLRLNYGLSERQLENLMKEAVAKPGRSAGELLLEYLERRLDNVVWRAGFAVSIPAARQLITHRHVRVNGRRLSFPSYRVKQGDVIDLVPRATPLLVVADALLDAGPRRPPWLRFDADQDSATITSTPDADHAMVAVDLRLVVEHYAGK